MPTTGVAIVFDAAFRAREKCRDCDEPLGDREFMMLIPIVGRQMATGQPPLQGWLTVTVPDLNHCWYEHTSCRRLMNEAEEAAALKPRG